MKLFLKLLVTSTLFLCLSCFFFNMQKQETISSLYHKAWLHVTHMNYTIFSKKITTKDIDTVVIKTINTAVSLKPTQINTLSADFTIGINQPQKLVHKKNNHTLFIKAKNQSPFQRSRLAIAIPSNIKRVIVKTISGSISTDRMITKSMTLKTTSGDITLENSESTQLNISSISGDIQLTGRYFTVLGHNTSGNIDAIHVSINNASLFTTSGDIKIFGLIDRFFANTTSGNVTIQSSSTIPYYQVNTVSSNILLIALSPFSTTLIANTQTGALVLDEKELSDHSVFLKFGPAEGMINLKTVSGDIVCGAEKNNLY